MARGLTNKYLNDITKKLVGHRFVGVYPCDVYPKTKKTCFSLIFNTAPKNSSGEHFVAVNVKNKSVFYFDPFGEPPKNDFINNYLKKISKGRLVKWNNVQIQDDSSNFCGFYCLGFLMSEKNRMPFDRFISLFSIKRKKDNDRKIIELIVSLIK